MEDTGMSARGGEAPSCRSAPDLCGGVHPVSHGAPVVAPGAGDRYIQRSTCLSLHPGYDHFHREGDAAEDQGWLQHPPPGGGHDTTVWLEAESLLHRGGASGTSLSVPNPQPIGTSGLRRAQCQKDYLQGGRSGVAAVWSSLPPHPAGGMGGGTGPGSGPGLQTGRHRRVPPRHR